ncbi:MAG: HDOD domain-containing protein [Gammaproteobacteria bacterium]|nr:HDOD domain-containing protein [Gammaproteobacteria bacterium]
MNNQKLLDQAKKTPPLSPVVIEVLNLINSNDEVDFSLLEKKIIQDAGLTGKMLSMANSSFFGMPSEIINVKEACLVLGINTIRNLVISSAVMDRFKDDYGNNMDFKKAWKHSVGTAAAAKVYAGKLGINQDSAFISGLLHDIGKMVIDFYEPDLYKKVIEYKDYENCLFIEAEQNILGTDHCEIGGLVCENWKLPTDICKVVKSHHDVVNIHSNITLIDIIMLADITSHGLGYQAIEDCILPIKDDSLLKKPGISTALIEENIPVVEAITESYINSI